MARSTDKKLRNQMMYQVFVRNYSEDGTFEAVRSDLKRIKSLGTDIIWLMPIHPIGKLNRKGSLGSPYAISDYREINPEFGDLNDFKKLVDDIHELGMKCIIDVVYNHTSPDFVLSKAHPDWFYHREDGSFGNRVGDWTDIIDLDYSNLKLWNYQIETLKFWAEIVDGFRCDVAPLIPVEFWEKAREEVEAIRPGCIWLSESVEPGFILHMRSRGLTVLSDSEIYRAFDISYDYDCYREFSKYLDGSGSLETYAEAVNRQEYTFPDNYVKLRFLENHDVPRASFLIPNESSLKNWTAFAFFQKGTTLIYNGEEYGISHLPSLFDRDTINWDKKELDLSELISRLSIIKKNSAFTDSMYKVSVVRDGFVLAEHISSGSKAIGVFSLKGETALVHVNLPDGFYINQIDNTEVEVKRGMIRSFSEPIIIISE